ncbi:MAG: DUF3576 domain-containing protein [Rickettsiales bacterium]
MKPAFTTARAFLLVGALLGTLSACMTPDADTQYPQTPEDRRNDERGKITGDGGLTLGGPSDKDKEAGKNPLGVNSFLWRATLDTLSFLPIAAADPFGGTILTDWYEDADAPGERYKVNVLILDRQLRADSLKISTFRQKKDAKSGLWADAPTDAKLGRKLEDTVLTRARELRVKQLGY